MSDQDMKPISVLTGTFAALKVSPETSDRGNGSSEGGKNVPQVERVDADGLAAALNVVSQTIGRDLRFQVNMDTGQSVIQVLDRETGEIIRQIPPENAKTYVSERGDVTLRLYDDRI